MRLIPPFWSAPRSPRDHDPDQNHQRDRGRGRGDRVHGDQGSVLMLMPAAVLIVLVLGAIAVDLSVVHLAERDILDVAASAANDAAAAGLPPDAIRTGQPQRLDRGSAERVARLSVAAQGLPAGSTVTVTVDVAAGEVTVVITRPVAYIFAKALPGSRDGTTVTATATAGGIER